MSDLIKSILGECELALKKLKGDEQTISQIEAAASLLTKCFKAGGQAISCGNGGSHCDAMHFAEELSGRFRKDRKPLAASAISDPAYISCTGNDFGFDQIFSRYVLAHGRKGDVLLAISTSGKSQNIINAAKQAKDVGMHVIAMTGKPKSALSPFATIEICTEAGPFADRVQELHIKVIHILIELIERQMFAENYKA